MASQETKSPKNQSKRSSSSPRSQSIDGILSPRFRSAAAMAGWDEETLLLASLIVEDTPIRESRHKKRPSSHHLKSPATTNSSRKRRGKRQRQSPDSMPAVVLCLDDEEETVNKDDVKNQVAVEDVGEKKMKREGGSSEIVPSTNNGLPCMDRLREELSCAICLEICFEPSTTQCGHSFCKKCLKCAAAKCGKRCPKCRQLISNGRSCTVNTVLWNTIQLLFPDEIEARRSVAASTDPRSPDDAPGKKPERGRLGVRIGTARSIHSGSSFIAATQVAQAMERDRRATIRRRVGSSQSEDAELALRLQREEFMEAFDDTRERPSPTVISARANLRAMAARAHHIRARGRY